MDLAFSPDVPAWACYLIVLVVGLIAAARRVATRLGKLAKKEAVPIWHFSRSWFLVFLYAAVPLGLFWLLDRTHAIHDTSLFAALIVAIGFERILAGTHSTLNVPGGAGGFWNPFEAFADSISVKITQQMHRAAERFDRVVLESLNDDRFAALKQLAMQVTPDVQKLEDRLTKAESERGVKGARYVRDIQARHLLEAVRNSARASADDWEALLAEERVIERSTYRLHSPKMRSRAFALVGTAIIAVVLVGGYLSLDRPVHWNRYYLWRIEKANITDADLYRTRSELAWRVAGPNTESRTYGELIGLLQDPELPAKRADTVLGVLLEHRCTAATTDYPLALNLVDALRTDDVDIRDRINQALVFMAPPGAVDSALKNWNPTEGESVTELEQKIEQWRSFWTGVDAHVSCERAWREEPAVALPIQPDEMGDTETQ